MFQAGGVSPRQLSNPSSKRPWHLAFGGAGRIALIATVLPVSGSLLVAALGPFIAYWLRGQGWTGVVLFTVAFAILGGLALAPTYTTSIIAGWSFGFRMGFPAVVIGTVSGAILGYLLARRMAAHRVQSAIAGNPRWELVRRALAEERPLKTLWIVFLLRLSPVLPFGTTNVLLATTGVPLRVYIPGTMLGLMPRVGLIALAAAGAEKLDFDRAQSWWVLAGAVVTTALCIAMLAIAGKRALQRATGSPQ